jgi:hypothetical protein
MPVMEIASILPQEYRSPNSWHPRDTDGLRPDNPRRVAQLSHTRRSLPLESSRTNSNLRARTMTSETKANRAGVVRAIAGSDHGRCVRHPRWVWLSSKVTSSDQHITTPCKISTGVAFQVGTKKGFHTQLLLRVRHHSVAVGHSGQHGEKRQRSHPPTPRHGRQRHERSSFDSMTLAEIIYRK